MNTIENQKMKKKIIFAIVILIVLLMIMLIVVSIVFQNTQKQNEDDIKLEYTALRTIEDVVKYYDCVYISTELNVVPNYNFDVNLEFCKPLYEENKSNEIFYNNIINDIARVSGYQNFRLIDNKNNIKIEVICENSKVYNIIINGIEDYFIYMNSQLSLREYKEIKITDFILESSFLINVINNNWNKDSIFATRESIYNQYNIYFDEGMKVRNIDSRIYNIIFTKKYSGSVVNGIVPGMPFDTVKQILGEPTFKDENLNVIGYKGNNFYIFFTTEEISVYRLELADTNEFFELIDKFLNKEIDFLEMMNILTYMWPDYSDYDYTSNKVFISYPQKGVDIKINYDNTTGIIVYNNFNADLSKIKSYFDFTEFNGLLQVDNVFEAEKRRIEKEEKEKKDFENYKQENPLKGYQSTLYNCYPILEEKYIVKIKFISKNSDRPNREINDTIDTFLWLNDVQFVFSKKEKGIYLYDLNTGHISVLIDGTFGEEYELKSFENGILRYDEKEVFLQF